VDPTNQTSSGLYYSYATNGATFEVSANPESQKYIAQASSNPNMFIAGSNTSLLTAGGIGSGPVSQANMKLSIASDTAFVDFGIAGSLTSYVGDKITIKDSSGNALVGYIKAAGTGQTYGSNLLPNSTFANTTNVNSSNATLAALSGSGYSGSNALQVTSTGSGGNGYEQLTTTVGELIQSTAYLYLVSGPYYCMNLENSSFSTIGQVCGGGASWTKNTAYMTIPNTTSYVAWTNGGSSGNVLNVSVVAYQQVLTPSATGVTIVSTSGGSSQNWTSMASGFNLNDSGGYTYSITLY